MISKEQVIEEIQKLANEENMNVVNNLLEKVKDMDGQDLEKILLEKNIRSKNGVRRFAKKKIKEEKQRAHKFTKLNDLISHGVNGKTVHIHVVPEDARFLLTREGKKQAELSLIDATEKIKEFIKTDKKYAKIKNVYAVSDIVHGIVARWFKNIGYDVKTLPIEEAKKDKELKHFYNRFQDKKKLGRANLDKKTLMSDEWEKLKNARKQELESSIKDKGIIDKLTDFNATDSEIIKHAETIKQKEPSKTVELNK